MKRIRALCLSGQGTVSGAFFKRGMGGGPEGTRMPEEVHARSVDTTDAFIVEVESSWATISWKASNPVWRRVESDKNPTHLASTNEQGHDDLHKGLRANGDRELRAKDDKDKRDEPQNVKALCGVMDPATAVDVAVAERAVKAAEAAVEEMLAMDKTAKEMDEKMSARVS